MIPEKQTRQKQIALGICGSVAAYKACELTRLCVKNGIGVFPIMTAAAQKFVTPLTFQTLARNPVQTDIFAPVLSWEPEHIAIAQKCALLVVAPCTANVLAKITHGIADDSLSAAALAFAPSKIILAPAMNSAMFDNPATQTNIATLRSRGITVIEPAVGELACGDSAKGRMPEPAKIYEIIAARIQ